MRQKNGIKRARRFRREAVGPVAHFPRGYFLQYHSGSPFRHQDLFPVFLHNYGVHISSKITASFFVKNHTNSVFYGILFI